MTRAAHRPVTYGEHVKVGGFAAVAWALNHAYAWPDDHKVISRQQVQAWNRRGSLNAAGQAPPSPVYENPGSRPPQPRRLFTVADWIEWARPGVPARHGSGRKFTVRFTLPVPAE